MLQSKKRCMQIWRYVVERKLYLKSDTITLTEFSLPYLPLLRCNVSAINLQSEATHIRRTTCIWRSHFSLWKPRTITNGDGEKNWRATMRTMHFDALWVVLVNLRVEKASNGVAVVFLFNNLLILCPFHFHLCRATRFMASRHTHSIWCHCKYSIRRDLAQPQRCSWWPMKAVSIFQQHTLYFKRW